MIAIGQAIRSANFVVDLLDYLLIYPFHFRTLKVYLIWVIREYQAAEWFHSLLHALEEQDVDRLIEVSIYLTARSVKEDDIHAIFASDVGSYSGDAITRLVSHVKAFFFF